jgi:hypothetical protein
MATFVEIAIDPVSAGRSRTTFAAVADDSIAAPTQNRTSHCLQNIVSILEPDSLMDITV